MKIDSVHLKNFRTYADREIKFDRRLVFITGRNAAGKTNIIEAVSMLSNGKSFRGASDIDMSHDSAPGYFLGCHFRRGDKSYTLEMGCDLSSGQSKKKIKLNGKVISGRSALIGNLITVIFSPSDLMIVEGGPSNRRKFLDALLSNQNRAYLSDLIQYNRALKHRNALLKKIRERKASPRELDAWSAGFVRYGERVIRERQAFIRDFKDIFHQSLSWISNQHDRFDIELVYSREGEETDLAGTLNKNTSADIAAGFTLTGPHRHNLTFLVDGKDILNIGSQGQKRTVVLALRIAEFHYIKKILGLSPLLLIDDVIRELDSSRRSAFIQLLHECGQAIFTTPDLDGLEDFLGDMKSDARIYEVIGNGNVRLNNDLEE